MIRWRFGLTQHSNHVLNVRGFKLILDYLKIPKGASLIYHVVIMLSCESGERHLVILARDDRWDLVTDGS